MTATEWPRHPCVLVAEDDVELRELLQWELSRRHIEVVSVGDGGDAATYMDVAFREPQTYPTPDLLLSDVRMPELDGLDLLCYASLWRVPTILVTSFGSRELHREAEKLGAVTCIDKPFDIVDLCDVVCEKVTA